MDAIGPKGEWRSCHRRYPIPRDRRDPACDTLGEISHIQGECEDPGCLEITPLSEQGWLEEASLLRARSKPGSVSIAPEGEAASGHGFPPEREWHRVRKTSSPRLLRRETLRFFLEV